MKSTKLAAVLSWAALLATTTFVVFAVGRRLHTELLAFPIIALSIAQLLSMRGKS